MEVHRCLHKTQTLVLSLATHLTPPSPQDTRCVLSLKSHRSGPSALSPETPVSHCSPGRQPLPHLLLSSSTWTSRVWPAPGTCNLGLCSLSALSLTSAAFPEHIHVIPLAVIHSPRAASTNCHFASLKGTFVNIHPSHWMLLLEQ